MSEEPETDSTILLDLVNDIDITIPHTSETVSYFNQSLREVVSIHEDAFKKLLFEQREIPLELAELFEHVGNRYLDFSIEISAVYRDNQLMLKSALKPLE